MHVIMPRKSKQMSTDYHAVRGLLAELDQYARYRPKYWNNHHYFIFQRIRTLSQTGMQELLVAVHSKGLDGALLEVYPMY